MIAYCPWCNAAYSYTEHTGDYVHRCSSQNATLDNEDVPFVGRATNPDGTATITPSAASVMVQGAENKLQGSRPGREGERLQDLTTRGNRKSTHQTRQHFQQIENPSQS